MGQLTAYLGIARAPFLTLPVALVAAGAAAGAYEGNFNWLHTVAALLGLLALHAAVNSLNEAGDMRTGIDLQTERTPFSGGSGTLPSGRLSVRQTILFSAICCAIGLIIGVWFMMRIGWVVLPLLIAGAFCILAYTDWLARIGLGEIAAGLGLGALPVAGTALVQDGTIGATAVAAASPAFFMTFNLLLLNEFPDEQADRAGGRRNLVILVGRQTAAKLYAAAALSAPVTILVSIFAGVLPFLSTLAVLPSLLLVRPFIWAFKDPAAPVPAAGLGLNVLWNLSTNLTLAVSLLLS